jgi:hypothetical protein
MVPASTQSPTHKYGRAVSIAVKRSEHEAGHTPPISAKGKNMWVCTAPPQYDFMAWCLVKNRDDFTFLQSTRGLI